MKNYLIF